MKPGRSLARMLAVTLGVLAPQVGAAEPGSSGSSDTSGSSVEVLVIRSQRHARGAQDASLSVTVLGAEQLEQRGIQDALDLARFVPNVNIQTSANGNGFFVNSRGISQDDAGLISRDPATAVYIDGVYWGRTQGNLINVLDLERVEVLRGPQGVLNGRNASAGAIHFVTRKPSGGTGTRLSLRSGTKLRGDLGLWQEFPVFGYGRPDAPHPWGRLSGSLALSTNHRDPDYRNDFGPDTGEERRLSGRVALHHEFGRFVADWSADYSHAREQGPEMQLTHVFGETATAVSLFPFENSDRAARIDLDADAGSVFLLEGGGTAPAPGLADDETDVFGTSLTIGVELENTLLGSARLRSITGYRSVEDRVVNDRDGSPIPVFTNVNQGDVAQVTQEFDLVGTRSLGGGEIDYVLGAFFLHDEGSQRSLAFAFGADGSQQTSRIHDKAQAVFGHASYTPGFLGGRLDLELGLRQTWERKRIDVERLDSGGASGVRARNDFRELTPMGGVGLRLHESARIWATISKGYTAGGFNARSTANDPYREETVLAYEVGLKLRSSQGRLRLDLAGFYQKYEDLQRTVLDFVGGRPSSVVRNAGRATIGGFEVEALAKPLPGLELNASYGLTVAEYQEFFDFDLTGCFCDRDFADERRFANAPRHSVALGGQLELVDLGWGRLVARLDYSWQSETLLQNGDEPLAGDPGHHLLHGRLALGDVMLPGDLGSFELAVLGRNLLDTEYRPYGIDFNSGSGGFFPYIVQYFGERRRIDVTLTWRFGSAI